MRKVIFATAFVATLILGILLVRPMPSATASLPEPASPTIDPYTLHLAVDVKTLPELRVDALF